MFDDLKTLNGYGPNGILGGRLPTSFFWHGLSRYFRDIDQGTEVPWILIPFNTLQEIVQSYHFKYILSKNQYLCHAFPKGSFLTKWTLENQELQYINKSLSSYKKIRGTTILTHHFNFFVHVYIPMEIQLLYHLLFEQSLKSIFRGKQRPST